MISTRCTTVVTALPSKTDRSSHIRQQLAGFPPLSDADLDRLTTMLRAAS